MNVQLPDNSVVQFPDSMSADQVNAAINSYLPSPQVADLNDPSNIPQAEAGYILNSAQGVPGLNLIKEAGAGLRGLYAGAIAPDGQSFSDAYGQEYDKSRANQDALMQAEARANPGADVLGKSGAALASMGFLPAPESSGSLVDDAAIGGGTAGGYGLLSGFGSGNSLDARLKNALSSGATAVALGTPLSMVAGGIGQAVNGYKNLANPSDLPAIQAAFDNDIPIYKNNISDSKALDYLATLSNEIPSAIGGTSGRVPAQQEAIANALSGPIGNTSGILNSDAIDTALKTSGQKIGDLISKNDLPVTQDTLDALDTLSTQAAKRMKGDNLNNFNQTIQNIKDEVQNQAYGQASSSTGIIPGPKYKELRTGMNEDIQANRFGSTATLSNFTKQVRNVMDDAFQAQLPADDALALQKARAIYGNASDLDTVAGEGSRSPTGDYSFGSLYGKLSDNPNYEGTALAAQLLKNQTGNSGTAQRQFIINTAKGLGSAALGAGGLYTEKEMTRKDGEPDTALHDTLMDVGGVGLLGAGLGGANRLLNPQITPSNFTGYQALQGVSPYANQLAELLRRMGPISSQINQGGN